MQFHKLFLWIIQCIYILPLVSSVELVIEPRKPIKLKYGEDFSLECRIKESSNDIIPYTSNQTAEDMNITLGGKVLEAVETKDRKAKFLYVDNPKVGRYLYYCSLNGQNKLKFVDVGTAPSNVTNFKCVSENLEALTCTWDISSDDEINLGLDIGTKYDLVYIVNGIASASCDIQMNGRKMWCTWSSDKKPVYRQTEEQLYFKLSARNRFGSNEQFFQINHYSIVKPNPPTVKLVSSSPHEATFIFKLHPKLVIFLRNGVDCKIEYEIPYYNNTVYLVDDNLKLINSITYRFDLPYANTEYRVRVYIKTAEATTDEFWSKATEVNFTTTSEIPRRPPDIPVGAFESKSYDDDVQRRIYVYWKQLEKYEEAGDDFKYIYKVGDDSKMVSAGNTGYLKLPPKSKEALHMSLWSKNQIGISRNSSHVFIPAHYDTYLNINAFTTFSYGNGTYVLSWKNVEKVDNFTLFWCIHNEARICKDRIDYVTIDGRNDKHIVGLPVGNRYQFALSANRGYKSSGMKWSKCELSKDTVAMTDFPINIISDAGPNYVYLMWDWDCIFNDGVITGYNITYFPVNQISNIKHKYIDNAKVKNTTISGLTPFTKYQFSVNVNTTFGPRSAGNPSFVETLQDKPSRPNIKLVNVTNTTVTLSVVRPYLANGNIKFIEFLVYSNGNIIQEDRAKCGSENDSIVCNNIEIRGLDSFTNYSLSVKAYNSEIGTYSEASEKLNIKTRIGRPSVMSFSRSDTANLQWKPPQKPGGNIDFYQIKLTTKEGERIENISRSKTSYEVESCADITYTIRAVNIDENPTNKSFVFYKGDWSDKLITTCRRSWWWSLIILGGIVPIVIFACTRIKLAVTRRKDIDVIFPPGLFLSTEIPDGISKENKSHMSLFSRLVEWAKFNYPYPVSCKYDNNENYNNNEVRLLDDRLLINLADVDNKIETQRSNEHLDAPVDESRLRDEDEKTIVFDFRPKSSCFSDSEPDRTDDESESEPSTSISKERSISNTTHTTAVHKRLPAIVDDKKSKLSQGPDHSGELSKSNKTFNRDIRYSKLATTDGTHIYNPRTNTMYNPKRQYHTLLESSHCLRPEHQMTINNTYNTECAQLPGVTNMSEPVASTSFQLPCINGNPIENHDHVEISHPTILISIVMPNQNRTQTDDSLSPDNYDHIDNEMPINNDCNTERAQLLGPTNMSQQVASTSSTLPENGIVSENQMSPPSASVGLVNATTDQIRKVPGQTQACVDVHRSPIEFKEETGDAPSRSNLDHINEDNHSVKVLDQPSSDFSNNVIQTSAQEEAKDETNNIVAKFNNIVENRNKIISEGSGEASESLPENYSKLALQ